MRALTVYQPWATLIACGAKPYEFRKWRGVPGLFGQRVAIHASVRRPRLAEIREMRYRIGTGESSLGAAAEQILASVALVDYPLGAIVATATLGESLSPDQVRKMYGGNDSDRDEHYSWAWPMEEVRRVEPAIPMRGKQGFWPVGPDALELIEMRELRP